MNFKQQLQQHLALYSGRISHFQFEGKKYWVKQVEQVSGRMCLLKPNPNLLFQEELQCLQDFQQFPTLIPKLIDYGDTYFVLDDAGASIDRWLSETKVSTEQKYHILSDSVVALAQLHDYGIAHGRPAIRDIAWQAGKITFLDFENKLIGKKREDQQAWDILIFLHSLFRCQNIPSQWILKISHLYAQHQPEIWQKTLRKIYHFRFAYFALSLFKPIARTDLMAGLALFELLLPEVKTYF